MRSRGIGARVAAAAVAAAFGISGQASAMSLPAPQDWFNHVVRADGGSGIALSEGDGGAWTRCVPSGADLRCEAVAPGPDGVVDVPPDTPVGTIWVVQRPDRSAGSSEPWGGPLRATAAPAIAGRASVGERISVTPGAWTGGFGREGTLRQIQVCRTHDATGCVVVMTEGHWNGCESTIALPARYAGWYLRAAERRTTRRFAVPPIAYLTPEMFAPWTADAVTTVSPVVGPIAEGTAPTECAPPSGAMPELRLRARVGREAGALAVARVRCPEACRATVRLRRRGRTVTLSTTAPLGRWTPIVLSTRAARRLGAGTLQATASVEAAAGTQQWTGTQHVSDRPWTLTLARRLVGPASRRR